MRRQSWCSATSGILVEREVTVSTEDRDDNWTPSKAASVVSVTSDTGQESRLSGLPSSSLVTSHDENMTDHDDMPRESYEETPSNQKGDDDIHYLVELLRQPPPPGNYMSAPDNASIASKDSEKWRRFKLFRKARKQEEPPLPPLALPDSAIPSTTSGGHRHIAISVPPTEPDLHLMPELQEPVSLGAEFQREMRRRFSTSDFGHRRLSPVAEEQEPTTPEPPLRRTSLPRNPWESIAKARLDLARASNLSPGSRDRPGPSAESRQDSSIDTHTKTPRHLKARKMKFYEQRATQGRLVHSSDSNSQPEIIESPTMNQQISPRSNPSIEDPALGGPLAADQRQYAKTLGINRAEALRPKRASFDERVLSTKRLSSIFSGHTTRIDRPASAIVQSSSRLDTPTKDLGAPMHIFPSSAQTDQAGPSSANDPVGHQKGVDAEAPLRNNPNPRTAPGATPGLTYRVISPVPDIDWVKYPVLSSVAERLNPGFDTASPPTTSYGSKWRTQDPLSPGMDANSTSSLFLWDSNPWDPQRQPNGHAAAADWASRYRTLLKLDKLRDNRLKRIEERLDKLEQHGETWLGSVVPLMENLTKLLQEQNTLLQSTKVKSQEVETRPRKSQEEKPRSNGATALPAFSSPPLGHEEQSRSYTPPSPFICLTASPVDDSFQSPAPTEEARDTSGRGELKKGADDQDPVHGRQAEPEDSISRVETVVDTTIGTATAVTQNIMEQYDRQPEVLPLKQAEEPVENNSEANRLRSGSATSTQSHNSSASEYSDNGGP